MDMHESVMFIPTVLAGPEFPVFFSMGARRGGVPFAKLGGAGLAMALAWATRRLAQVLVTCH
jgi:hypothetical protein